MENKIGFAKELADISTNMVEQMIRIADKYKRNRTATVKTAAMTFFEAAMVGNFDKWELEEKKGTDE